MKKPIRELVRPKSRSIASRGTIFKSWRRPCHSILNPDFRLSDCDFSYSQVLLRDKKFIVWQSREVHRKATHLN